MKNILAILFLFGSFHVFGQTETANGRAAQFFVDQIVMKLNGTELQKSDKNDWRTLYAEVPSSYTFDLIKIEIKTYADSFKDVIMLKSWNIGDDESYNCWYSIANGNLIIKYFPKDKILCFLYYYKMSY